MQWGEFLDTAERLARGTTEGDWRSAISRSYYAVFHHVREFLLAYGLDVGRGGQSHFNLYSGLWNCGFAPVATIARRIDDLRANRVAADYDLARFVSQRVALSIVQESRDVVADFQAVLTSLSPAQIVDGSRRYLQSIGRLPSPP